MRSIPSPYERSRPNSLHGAETCVARRVFCPAGFLTRDTQLVFSVYIKRTDGFPPALVRNTLARLTLHANHNPYTSRGFDTDFCH